MLIETSLLCIKTSRVLCSVTDKENSNSIKNMLIFDSANSEKHLFTFQDIITQEYFEKKSYLEPGCVYRRHLEMLSSGQIDEWSDGWRGLHSRLEINLLETTPMRKPAAAIKGEENSYVKLYRCICVLSENK